jgi:hypothetical protein
MAYVAAKAEKILHEEKDSYCRTLHSVKGFVWRVILLFLETLDNYRWLAYLHLNSVQLMVLNIHQL